MRWLCGFKPCGSWCFNYGNCEVLNRLPELLAVKIPLPPEREFNGRIRRNILAVEKLSKRFHKCRSKGRKRLLAVQLAREKLIALRKLEMLTNT